MRSSATNHRGLDLLGDSPTRASRVRLVVKDGRIMDGSALVDATEFVVRPARRVTRDAWRLPPGQVEAARVAVGFC